MRQVEVTRIEKVEKIWARSKWIRWKDNYWANSRHSQTVIPKHRASAWDRSWRHLLPGFTETMN